MVESEKYTEELLTKIESTDTPGEESNTGGSGKSRGKKESIRTKEYRKKKQDALEGRENRDVRGHEEDSEGKHGHSDSGKGDSSEKGSGSGPQNQSSLQSGQTTVQFSSGGGVGSFGSLLALFASSASLIRAESAFISTLSFQTTNVNLQNILRAVSNQTGTLIGDEGKNIKYIGNVTESTLESVGKQLNVEFGGSIVSRGTNINQDILSNILKVISIHAMDERHDVSGVDKIPFITTPLVTIYVGFNPYTFFFTESTPFAFSNSPKTSIPILDENNKPVLLPDGSPAVALKSINLDIIDTYFKEAGLTVSKEYTYKVISPIVTAEGGGAVPQPIPQVNGLTVNKEGDLTVNISPAPQVVGSQNFGLTLTPSGDLYANVLHPLSVLVEIAGSKDKLPVRINVGPGEVIDTTHFPAYPYYPYTGFLNGLHQGLTDEFASTVFQVYRSDKIVGNASAITLNSQDKIIGNAFVVVDQLGKEFGVSQYGVGNLVYIKGLGVDSYTVVLGGFNINDTYSFPSNTIFRHIGSTNETAPTTAAYGNFSSHDNVDFSFINQPSVTHSTFTLLDGHSYNLTLGGNVLDVFGTKYGVGDVLDLYLASSPTGPNNITMGGNTLAGFGASYGDLDTLNISARPVGPHSSTQPTLLTFNGNILWVDKDVGSTLYPHLKDLALKSNLTVDSNLKIVFGDSIVHGNVGPDSFYGDVYKLGDIHDASRYNAFVRGVNVVETGEGAYRHIVTTPTYLAHIPEASTTDSEGVVTVIPAHDGNVLSTNSITWGNNVYVGGADSAHPSNKNINTYHFTLVGTDDLVPKPVFLGNALITDFVPSVDTLVLQLTPALFRSLDVDHNKIITPSDLNSGVTSFDQAHLIYNPLTYDSYSGTIINFTGGGSLSLQGVALNNFNDISIPNLKTEVILSYIPIANLAPELFTPTMPILTTPPIPTAPYVYGNGPNGSVHPYYLELDHYFANSLYAHYTVSGLTDPLTDLPIEGVTIDQYGSITVDTLTPYIVPLVITATDDHGAHVTSDPLTFAFLNAPITVAADSIKTHAPSGTSNILIGGLNSEIVAGKSDTNLNPVAPGDISQNTTFSYGSNLIVDTANSTSTEAYGDFKTVVLNAEGKDDFTADSTTSVLGSIHDDVFDFKANAFYVKGTVLGVATSLEIAALGGDNSVIHFSPTTTTAIDLNATAHFESNTINIGSQVIYGNGSGILTGDFRDIIINAVPGTPKTLVTEASGNHPAVSIISGFDIPVDSNAASFTGSINTSSSIQHNIFDFGITHITILDDNPTQISTIIANVEDLIITAKSTSSKVVSSTLTNISRATFADNHFIFDDADLKGGAGGTNFFGHLATFGDAFDHDHYGGFAKGVTVTYDNSHLTIVDSKVNTITWGNNIYTGGVGADSYNYTLVQDAGVGAANKFPIMQGFDVINDFDFAKDTLIFNITRNLFENLGMNENDTQLSRSIKLGDRGVEATGTNDITISFTGPLGSMVPYGKLSLHSLNAGGAAFTDLSSLNFFSETTLGRECVIINVIGVTYSPPALTAGGSTTFDPVFVKIDQPLAFESFITNADTDSLTWGLALGTSLPAEFSFSPDGTLSVFSNSAGLTPVDAYISVTVHDDISPTNITTIPSIHIFALNATSQQAIRNATTQGTTATEIFETNQGGNVIHGGGADIIYNPMTPIAPLIYGSKLIYDISEGGHTAIGDVEKIQFLNVGDVVTTSIANVAGHGESNLTGQSITFGPNMFNINSGGQGVIYGNAIELDLTANAGNDGHGILIDASISANKFYFGPNTIYTVVSAAHGAQDSFTVYGNLKTLTINITNPSNEDMVGDAYIKNNEFNFGANKLYGSNNTATLNPGIGVLNIENKDVAIHDPQTQNPSPITGNIFTFSDSTLTSGVAQTFFNADIADLSNTDFVKGTVTFRDDVTQPVQVIDSQGNVINWGNNTYNILPGSQASTLTFTLLSLDANGNDATMQGNAKIDGFRSGTDKLDFKLAPTIFKALNTIDFDRKLTTEELQNPTFMLFPDDQDPSKTTITFASSLAAGSIIILGHDYSNITSLGLGNVTAELAYTPTPITVHSPAPDFTPLIFVANGGTGTGVYGNILDNYFDNIDIGNVGSTYEVTLSSSYEQVIDPTVLFNATNSSALFDEYGTARTENVTDPILSIINVKPNDVNDAGNTANVDLVVAAFNGTQSPDGTLTGSLTNSSYLLGSSGNQTLIGNADQMVFNATNTNVSFNGNTYGTDGEFGGNLIINTNAGNTAYGVASDISFLLDTTHVQNSTLFSGTMNFLPNALYVNGTVAGIADKFLIEAQNTIAGIYSGAILPLSSYESNTRFAQNSINFDGQTIFGQGTLTGDMNLFFISVIGNTTASIVGPGPLVINAFTEVRENTFTYAPTEIIVLGDEHSSIFPHINSLSFFLKHGVFINDSFEQITLNAPAVIEENKWIFQDSVAIGGSGGVDYYSDINDLSSTSFWTSDALEFINTGDGHVNVIDSVVGGFTNMGNNSITWGNNKLYLSSNPDSLDTIHLNVLRDPAGKLGLLGSLNVHNFEPTKDTIHFNLSPDLYSTLNGGSTILKGLVTASTLNGSVHISSDTNTTISFDYGSLNLEGVSGYNSLVNLPNVQVGTTLVGTPVSDSFGISVGTSFADFKEYDDITHFNPSQDTLRFALSPTAYAKLTQYGLLSSTDLISEFSTGASTANGAITITHANQEFPLQDPSYAGATVDSTINFVTNDIISGSVTLHNVDISDLSSSFIQLGQIGTNSSDTFYFVVPGSDFSSFTAHTFIDEFDNAGADRDNIEIIVPKALYDAINPTGTQNPASAISSLVGVPGIGGVIATLNGSNTDLQFKVGSTVAGVITLEGVNTTLNGLGSHLHLGYLDTGTAAPDTFAFNITGSSFGTFNQFDHIRYFDPFDPSEDILRITVPLDLYNSINTEGSLSGVSLSNALASAANTSLTGGIFPVITPAHYDPTGSDTVLSFKNADSPDVTGSITLHGDSITQLGALGSHFQFGSMQDGTTAINTFSYNTPANAVNNFSAFQQFDYINGYEVGRDNIDIALPVGLFNNISVGGTHSSAEIALDLKNNTFPGLGDINVVNHDGSTSLEFVSNTPSTLPSGSITLVGVTLPNHPDLSPPDLDTLGGHLHFGSIQQGIANNPDIFQFNHAENGNLANLSGFKEFDHILDFNPLEDTLTIKISDALYTAINNDHFPGTPPLLPPGAGVTTSSELVGYLDAGTVNGAQISVTHATAQYGFGLDSILKFMTSGVMSGSITLHNVSINHITELPNIVVAH